MNLVSHLESRLGQMEGGWKIEVPKSSPLMVSRFRGGQISGVTSFATVGLSQIPLKIEGNSRVLHLEFLGCSYDWKMDGYGPWPGILEVLAANCVSSGTAVLRGSVISLPSVMADGSHMTALYAGLPVYFDDEFSALTDEVGRRVAVVWLIPVGLKESAYIAQFGWRSFEQKLIETDPDLLDIYRSEVV